MRQSWRCRYSSTVPVGSTVTRCCWLCVRHVRWAEDRMLGAVMVGPLVGGGRWGGAVAGGLSRAGAKQHTWNSRRSDEDTSEIQSRVDLVRRLLLEKRNAVVARTCR